ncbi:sialidase family protein [Tessaracoccus defluvii]|uniref:Exo-alpha-sialidase n=1 Tax=Tessaracoccus defluvii TaxID=1285901 RepID=A0A7H0H691_9ACTN|nr:sialidase family protein [Tessaracoccus defluvii]QNP56057.1 exo-alpha-sialidase [Tessaracoccus defluvii]
MHVNPIGATVVHRGSVGESGSMYTRLLSGRAGGPLEGVMLLTWERRLGVADSAGPTFPIYRSEDGGETWEEIAAVPDLARHAGNRYQPTLYELPCDVAHLKRGDVLLAGNAIPRDGAFTCLVLYSSADGGYTWNLESVIDEGGPSVYDNSSDSVTTAIWEPDLDVVDGKLLCYFADERTKPDRMLQSIRRRTSTDLRTWSDLELVSGVANSYHRPGMFVGTGALPDGSRRAVIEVVGPHDVPVYLLESQPGEDWGDPGDLGRQLVADDGVSLSGTPTIGWHALPDGRVVLVALGRHSMRDGREGNRGLVSLDLGDSWSSFELPTPADRRIHGDASGYSQTIRWNQDGHLVQATSVRNAIGSHDVVVTRALMVLDVEVGA